MEFFKKIFDRGYKELEKFKIIANEIVALESVMAKLTDEELKAKTTEFKKRLEKETLEDIKVEAFAVAREAAYRVLGETAFYTQILGGLAIHYGNIAEMKTGEGKTLASTMPAYLNALAGNGVHIITVNEYLVERDAEWMGKIYNFLGLTVGANKRELTPKEKQEVYKCDITYSTNNEIGFDYLRDNMVINAKDRVQRPLSFVIIDEVDSVLIDEARTPLIISGGAMKTANFYMDADKFAKSLSENKGYVYDEKTKIVTLDEVGIAKAEKVFNLDNLYDLNNTNLLHYINQALKANYAMNKDVDYVVEEDNVVIVDPFTGRLMKGRQYSEGLHQAIEAKEGVSIKEETKTLATITFQNLFRMYKKISGMTGTAKTEEEEFREIYNMYVICIPTNKPIIRTDYGDLIFATKQGKYKAILEEIKEKHAKGQPLLIGTVAVETSELLSKMLQKEGIKHEVLNAKNHAREAEIIANAGKKGAVTIATNMAGRGTDIKINDEVKALGGLCVIGTERHESRRIDNQLRGRSGRQGDPGYSQFCVSFEDELMVRFGTDRIQGMLARVGFDGDLSIRNSMFSGTIESAQKRVEGNNFDVRKGLLQYDDVINNQREVIYAKRNEILDNVSIHATVLNTFKEYITDLILPHTQSGRLSRKDLEEILEPINGIIYEGNIKIEEIENRSKDELITYFYDLIVREYEKKLEKVPKEVSNEFEKAISLRVIDLHWMDHINTMAHLKEGSDLRSLGNEDPLRAYTTEGYALFENLLMTIDKEITMFLMKAEVRQNIERKEVAKGVANDGKVTKQTPKTVKKVGRNDLCPCGSGKKYKHCCGR